ncbi:MAG: hypothetical protein NT040_02610 [Bacteroidetes bacterium]|nr:hypothetical protein [Bacteroidota bacterium]
MNKLNLVLVCAAFLISATGFSQSTAPASREYKTKTGKIITVNETHPQGASLSNITVAIKGNAGSVVQFTDADPINKVLVADLDGNGFSEIYITTVSAGSGSYGNVIGVASNKDKSLSQITFPEVGENDLKKGAKFEGYEGHDIYEIKDNALARTFPVKTPVAAKHVVKYKLKAGEAAFQLVIAD